MYDKTIISVLRELLNYYFKINDKPAGDQMSDGQIWIVASILFKIKPRIACLAPTGYGKSEAVSMGVILRAYRYHEMFVVASVKYDTAGIIMKKIIEHLFDNPNITSELEIDTTKRLSQLKRERNKTSLNFKSGGGIKIVSLHGADADVSNAIGEHSPNVVLDESPLLTPSKYLIVLKVLEGTGKYEDSFLFELGNAINRNHFMQNVKFNSEYEHIDISLEQAIAEGRLDPKSIDEKRDLPNFEEFYLCKFPDEDEMDEKGYKQLLTLEDVQEIIVDSVPLTDEPQKLGGDIGGGGDYNVYAIRQNHNAWIEGENRSNDTMVNVSEIQRIIEESEVIVTEKDKEEKKTLLKPEDVSLDDIGIGRGVTDRSREKKVEVNGKMVTMNVNGVAVGEKAREPERYANKKAEYYWRLRMWALAKDKDGKRINKLKDHRLKGISVWQQLTWIKYKTDSDKVIQIEPKQDLKERTGKSPDFAEALMLTFADGRPEPRITWLE